MTGLAWVLLAAAAAVAALDWRAVAVGSKALEYVAKPGALALLVGVAVALDPGVPGRRVWFVVALVLSLAGDVFLMVPRDLFVFGLGSFLLGHVAYVVGFRLGGGTLPALWAGAAVVVVLAAAVAPRIVGAVRRAHPELLLPVVAYLTVISVMVATALATGLVLAGAGALLFFGSDAMIAWNRFVAPKRWLPLAIIVTYHVGQGLLVLSLTSHP